MTEEESKKANKRLCPTCGINREALYSAKYILEHLLDEGGILYLHKITGLPEGTIKECLNNIFEYDLRNS